MTQFMVKRFIHWAIVVSVVVAYASAYYRSYYTTQLEVANWYCLVLHMNAGALVFVLAILAFILRRKTRLLKPAVTLTEIKTKTSTAWPARLMHLVLYAMLFGLPISAYLGTGVDFPLLGIVNLVGFMRFEMIQGWLQNSHGILMMSFMEPFADFHKNLGSAYLLPTLLLGHVGAALAHKIHAFSPWLLSAKKHLFN
ncbi:MAG: cytochrome b/b6 domain-containing protein [Bermanella sp.]